MALWHDSAPRKDTEGFDGDEDAEKQGAGSESSSQLPALQAAAAAIRNDDKLVVTLKDFMKHNKPEFASLHILRRTHISMINTLQHLWTKNAEQWLVPFSKFEDVHAACVSFFEDLFSALREHCQIHCLVPVIGQLYHGVMEQSLSLQEVASMFPILKGLCDAFPTVNDVEAFITVTHVYCLACSL